MTRRKDRLQILGRSTKASSTVFAAAFNLSPVDEKGSSKGHKGPGRNCAAPDTETNFGADTEVGSHLAVLLSDSVGVTGLIFAQHATASTRAKYS